MVLILLAAAAVSFFTSFVKGDSEYVDSIIILAIVVVNAITGMIQESRAEKAIEALRKLSTPHARVVRGGKSRVIDSTGLVPGDLVQLRLEIWSRRTCGFSVHRGAERRNLP